MRLWKKLLLVVLVVVLCLAGLFVLLIGPWPTYGARDVRTTGYFAAAVAAVDRQAEGIGAGVAPEPLRAGWASRSITPPVGAPLAGFGDRMGKPSTGVHDDLLVKALVLGDGADAAVIVGSDMLIVPENLADAVRARVAEETGLTAARILFNATHTHSGPGGWGPGFAAKGFSGTYDPAILDLLTQAFTEAVVEAAGHLEPAALAHGRFEAPDLIRNRTREGDVDAGVGYCIVEQEDGDRCYVVAFSAHPTLLGGDNMRFSGDFPGFVQRTIEARTGAFAMYLGGAVGSMSARAPEGADDFARAQAMGETLAERVLADAANPQFVSAVDVAAVGASIPTPPYQLRLTPRWRLSPFVFRMVGIDRDAWIQGVRLGDLYLVGTPCDFSGELSRELHQWATANGRHLWMLSFNGDYVGYISPDRYYLDTDEKGRLGYEMGMMSWCGPNGGSYFTELTRHTVAVLAGTPDEAS